MTFDINAYLGHFALRQLRHNTAPGLLALMDRKGIDRALVSSAASITYKDAHAGNEELAREVEGNTDRLVPCAVLNPAYAGWERDLETCVGDMGMKALKLYPHWHNYKLGDACCDALVTAATEHGLPVLVPMRAVDGRQLGWLFEVQDVPPADLVGLVQRHPAGRFVVLEGLGIISSPLVTDRANLPQNYWVELSRMCVFMGGEIPRLVEELGPERLLLGTGMPFKYADPMLLKMDKLQADESVKARIRGGNAAALLGG